MIYDSILQTIGRTPIVRINRLAPKHVTMYAKVRRVAAQSDVGSRQNAGSGRGPPRPSRADGTNRASARCTAGRQPSHVRPLQSPLHRPLNPATLPLPPPPCPPPPPQLEYFNPLSSVKDRLALALILDAEASGALKPGQTVVEATSGNTGIALAGVCAARGYPFVATMAESFSVERRKIMRLLGARVILTPAAERASGMVRKAEELAAKHGWFLARQFENPANPAFHRNTTGPEILSDFAGRRLDVFVSGWGTGGTLSGVGAMLRAARPDTRIVATEPEGAQLLAGQPFTPHKIQGWTPNFVPAVLDRGAAHEVVPVSDADAIATARELARKEGIFCGAWGVGGVGGGGRGGRAVP